MEHFFEFVGCRFAFSVIFVCGFRVGFAFGFCSVCLFLAARNHAQADSLDKAHVFMICQAFSRRRRMKTSWCFASHVARPNKPRTMPSRTPPGNLRGAPRFFFIFASFSAALSSSGSSYCPSFFLSFNGEFGKPSIPEFLGGRHGSRSDQNFQHVPMSLI